MKKSILAFDFDDVLFDITPVFLDFHRKKYGYAPDYEEITGPLSKFLDISDEEEDKRWDEFFQESDYLSVPPAEDQISVLNQLKEKFDLIIVTNRSKEFEESLIKWINKHLPDYFSDIIFAKRLPAEDQKKSSICKKLGIISLVDDEPENIISCVEDNVPVIIYDRPWNRNFNFEAPRAFNFEELLEII